MEIKTGLPSAIEDQFAKCKDVIEDQDEVIRDLLLESCVLDCTQKRLGKIIRVPYIGWHPVNDRMTSKVPYEVTHSYQRGVRREFGIPEDRKK